MSLTATERGPLARDDQRPSLHGKGPAGFSTCRALSVVPAYIFDVNGYYRELGVSPYASRGEIGRAYIEAEGSASVRLTFVYKQLINKKIRRAYDMVPLGGTFMDEWVQRELYLQMKRAAMARADLEQAAGNIDPARYDIVVDGIMDWLIEGWENGQDSLPDVLDADLDRDQDDDAPAKAQPVFPYSYYLWKTKTVPGDEYRLAEWLGLLLKAFAEQGVQTRISVGLHGQPYRYILGQVGYRDVVMLNISLDPDIEVARAAVRSYQEAEDSRSSTHQRTSKPANRKIEL